MPVQRRGTKIPPIDAARKAGVKAGILAGATYPEQTYRDALTGEDVPDKRAGMPVAVIARANNYGNGRTPPRPFMDQTIVANKAAWSKGLVSLIAGGTPLKEALATIGQVMMEDIQTTIQDWPADNSPEWADHKGYNHGLHYTSVLLRSVKFETWGV